jgi:16S rRNA (guanine527-N7)-methyltransferase
LEKNSETLKAGLRELGIESKAETIAAFELYLQELKKWTRVHNITSITDDSEIVVKHFLDSLIYLKAIPPDVKTLCDVGSGGGFPALPIAIIRRDIEYTLLEPARKKSAFLRRMKRLLSLRNIEIIESRAEEVEDRQFDIVVTRATFSVSDMLRKAGHLMNRDGLLIMSKGPKYEDELSDLQAPYRVEIMPVSLAVQRMTRNLIIVRKEAG